MRLQPAEAEELADRYERDGVVVVRNAVPDRWLERLRESTDEALKQGKRYFAYRNLRNEPGGFQDFCLTSGIGRLVAEIGRSTWTSLVFDTIFVKDPGSRTRTGWHTDQPYWPIAGPIVTTWIALDPVDADNGAMEFVLGSHAWGKKYRPFLTDQKGDFVEYLCKDDPQYCDMPDFEAERDRHEMVHWELDPGDVLAFDGFMVHSAMGNRTATRRRRGYAVRFALDRATYDPGQGVADWLVDDSIEPGAPYVSERFPCIYSAGIGS
ncbi:MAG: phytanoyl-CoA dioxygenase family protein [Rhodobacteraceae bacterium]|nr:phytanoyl-CoA dioxygenase family protein [Paracoccaceae bacterium]